MIALSINGKSYNVDVTSRYAITLGDPRHDRAHWHEIRLRHRPMRRLHRTHQWRRHAFLPGAHQHQSAPRDSITTIEALAQNGKLHPVQQAWLDLDVPQCGYCQSGMMMAAADLLKHNPKPTDADIDAAITKTCRCGTYQRIRAAIHAAADHASEGTPR